MTRISKLTFAMLAAAIFVTVASAATTPAAMLAPLKFDGGSISGLGARNIGSATMSGRIAAIDAVDEKNGKTTIYVGAASGGVWKSSDSGTTYKPVFDRQDVQSIGAITIDPTDPRTIWVGTGEPWTRNSVSIGDGIYKSSDGGETWTHLGLEKSERIAKIIIDPKDHNTVYACVPGNLWSDSADRGLYKTSDAGKSWTQVLKGANLSTGCASISMDPQASGVLFASLWDFRRKGWTFRSGGENPTSPSASGLFRSTDGGAHWSEISDRANKGFPLKPYGRIAVSVAPSNNKIVYAMVESPRSALFRSDDGGQTWEERDRSQLMVWRPFYFATLFVDPTNPERLFKPDLGLIMSEDGGKSFSNISGGTHGDHHAVWIDPKNPQQVITGDDGGIWYSQDGGSKWRKGENLPISQFYHVSVDDRDPYQVYGGLQDNSSWVGQSEYPGGIGNAQWENMYGGDGFWSFSDPADPDYLYTEAQGGTIGRINRKTHETRDIQPRANFHEKLRFNWNTPIALSPNEKGTIYLGAQFLFRSRDHGQSWDRISPDLTTNDPLKQKQEESGGVTVDNSAAEMHTTIYSISESPKNAQLIWVGTDDGNLQLTRDGGKSWNNMVGNISGLPKNSWVSWVEASRFDEAVVYAAFDRHSFGDMQPWVYRSKDYGKSWTRIVAPSQGVRGYAHVIREDTIKPELLFLGTEFGLWVSIDGGAQWAHYQGGNFPDVAVRDLVVQPRTSDLVLATHGRGIWIIDDITPLRALTPSVLNQEATFIEARPQQQRLNVQGGWPGGDAVFTGDNPPNAAVITYYQKSRHLFGKIKLEILDNKGVVLDSIAASKRRGLNRVTWSMRIKPPRVPSAAQVAFNASQGPRVLPGDYTVRLTKGKEVYTAPLKIGIDARAKYSLADRQQEFDAAMRVHALFGTMTDLVYRINAARGDVQQRSAALPEKDALRTQLANYGSKLDDVRKLIVATKEGGAITGEERIREHMDSLYGAIVNYEGRPSDSQLAAIDTQQRELSEVAEQFSKLNSEQLPKLNSALTAKKMVPITIPDSAPEDVGQQSANGEKKGGWFERD